MRLAAVDGLPLLEEAHDAEGANRAENGELAQCPPGRRPPLVADARERLASKTMTDHGAISSRRSSARLGLTGAPMAPTRASRTAAGIYPAYNARW
jgi:hypothetical protein